MMILAMNLQWLWVGAAVVVTASIALVVWAAGRRQGTAVIQDSSESEYGHAFQDDSSVATPPVTAAVPSAPAVEVPSENEIDSAIDNLPIKFGLDEGADEGSTP